VVLLVVVLLVVALLVVALPVRSSRGGYQVMNVRTGPGAKSEGQSMLVEY
jgi:hypothetical protein